LSGIDPDVSRWLAAEGVRPATVRRLEAATTAELFAIDDLVLRWYAGGTFLDEEPAALRREVAALLALRNTPVPAPRLVAWSQDPPAVLMTHVPGRHRLDAGGPHAVRSLLDAIHATDPGPFAEWSYRGYHEGRDLRRPIWWRDARLWDLAVDRSAAGPARGDPVVIHRDYHPGNILWSNDVITGVVDWGNTCLGPAAFDLAHYRVNLASLVGPDVTDREFPGDPEWDIEAALGFVDPWDPTTVDAWGGPWPHVAADIARTRLEAFVSRAVASLR
jgi:aminoglycoside phosphotransferase (APT) family kinase protein